MSTEVKCPHCRRKFSHIMFGEMLSGGMPQEWVSKTNCPRCRRKMIVEKIVTRKVTYKTKKVGGDEIKICRVGEKKK